MLASSGLMVSPGSLRWGSVRGTDMLGYDIASARELEHWLSIWHATDKLTDLPQPLPWPALG